MSRKQMLGMAAARLVRRGQVIFIDVGSTNFAIASALPSGQDLQLVTNAPDIAEHLVRRGDVGSILLVGGVINAHSGGTAGAIALQQVQRLNIDLCFLGACAVDASLGIAAYDVEDAAIKRALVEYSSAVAVAITNEKLGTGAPHRVADLSQLDYLVVEADAPAARLNAFAGHEITLLKAEHEPRR
jgi:DeoR/GlpR family transcriptional regulator of sugar metabolism